MGEFIFDLQRFEDITNTVVGANVFGSYSSDVIYNYGRFARVWASGGNDRITNWNNDYSTVYGEDGSDTISNNGRATLYGGNGDDVIYHDNDYSFIDGGAGDDHIYIQGYGSNNTIIGGADNNSIIGNGKAQVYLCYGEGDDTIDNYGENSTIKIATETFSTMTSNADIVIKIGEHSVVVKDAVGKNLNVKTFVDSSSLIENADEDNDVTNQADDVTLQSGKGKDTLRNSGKNVLLSGGDDDDYLGNSGANATLHGDKGNDTIFNHGENSTINGYEDNDYINNTGASVTVNGNTGNDWINNSGSSVTIKGGKENDFIKNSGANVVFEYAVGDGYDVIEGFNETSTLKISDFLVSNRYSKSTVGNDVYVNVGGEAIIIKDGVSLSKINIVGTEITPEADSRSPENTYSFTEGDDNVLIHTYGEFFTGSSIIYLLGGNDSIYIGNYANFNSISGGDGSDTVNNSGTYVSITGGAGDDSIWNYGLNSTVKGDDGNDEIYNRGESTSVFGDAGNDSIRNTGDKVTMDGGAGNDTISNSWQDAALMYGGEGDDVISLGGEYTGTFWYKGNTLVGGTGNDTIYNDGQEQIYKYFAGDGDDVIVGFHEKDTLCIVNEKYTSSTSDNDVMIKIGSGSLTLKDAADKTIIINGMPDIAEPQELEIGQGDDTSDDSVDDTSDDSVDDTSDDSVDDTSDDSVDDATDDSVDDTADDSVDDTVDDSVDDTSDDSVDDATDDSVDDTADDSVDDTVDDSVDDTADDSLDDASDDSVDDATDDSVDDASDDTDNEDILNGSKGKDDFIYNGGKVVITDYQKKDKIDTGTLAYESYSIADDDLIFDFGGDNSLTIQNGAGKAINLNSTVNFYTADGILDKNKKSITLASGAESFSAKNYSQLTTIDGSATGAIEILGNNKANIIYAGASGSTLAGGKGKDSLVGGDGADLFIYDKGDGKDVVENYGAGDKISLGADVELKDAKIKKGNAIFKVKGGALTVNDTTDVTFAAEGNETIFSGGVFTDSNSVKVLGSFKGTVDLSDYEVSNVDATLAKKKLTLAGDDSANYLVGGKGKDCLTGGAGNDTLWGGKGKDSLFGGEGDDVFIFQAGNGTDTILDYASGELLTILNKRGDEGDFKKATFKDDTLTLAIQGGGKVIFSGVNTSTNFNINGDTYHISNNSLTK